MRKISPDLRRIDEAEGITGDLTTRGADATRVMRELCHDLIVPAATIKLLAEAASKDSGRDGVTPSYLKLISDEAAKISAICSHVLGRSHPRVSVQLYELIAQQIQSTRMMYETALEFEAEPVLAEVAPAIFTRVIGNLLVNACEAAGPAGLVRVALTRDRDGARICIDDSGPGFSAPRMEQTSYGLQIVWSLVLRSQGSVQMGVSDLGGVRVAVTFPGLAPAEPMAAPDPGPYPPMAAVRSGQVQAGQAARATEEGSFQVEQAS